jgi:DNA-binding NarL/FixJ family response regulator
VSPKRVVVVDDDGVSRRGLTELLSDHAEIEMIGSLSHGDAMTWAHEWRRVDVAIVDAADERQEHDHFPGVAVVDRIRRYSSATETVVIVITGHFFDDALRRRMREASADFLYHRTEIQEASQLQEAVLHPEDARRVFPMLDAEGAFRLGVTASTRVNEALAFADIAGLRSSLSERAGSRSRAWLRQRKMFNRVARLNPVNADGTIPDREQDEPSLPQIERFLEWASKSKMRGS